MHILLGWFNNLPGGHYEWLSTCVVPLKYGIRGNQKTSFPYADPELSPYDCARSWANQAIFNTFHVQEGLPGLLSNHSKKLDKVFWVGLEHRLEDIFLGRLRDRGLITKLHNDGLRCKHNLPWVDEIWRGFSGQSFLKSLPPTCPIRQLKLRNRAQL